MTQNNTPVSYIGKHTFTSEEKESKLQQMLTAMRVKEEIEDELKTTKSTYKAKIDSKDAEIKLISNLLNAGFEDRTFQCQLVKNFDEGKRQYIELGSNNLVGEEPLTAADYQIQMDLDEKAIKANNEAADIAQEVTEVLEGAGLRIVPDEAPLYLTPEEIEAAEAGPAIEIPTPTEGPEVIIETVKTKPIKNEETIVIEPTTDELEADPFSDDADEEDDPFSFGDI